MHFAAGAHRHAADPVPPAENRVMTLSVLLDLMLPGVDGPELMVTVRGVGYRVAA